MINQRDMRYEVRGSNLVSRISYLVLVGLFLLASIAHSAVLDPTKLGLGARSVALGRCAAALELDSDAAFINPALGAELKQWGLNSMLVNLSDDIAYNQLGMAFPQGFGTLGISYLGATSGGIIATTVEAGRIEPSGFTFDYSNALISLLYANIYSPDLSYGANLKYFQRSFTSVSTGRGYDLDLGLLWKPQPKLKIGVTGQNILPSPIGGMTWDTGAKEGIPYNLKAGLSYRALDGVLLCADLDQAHNRPLLFHGGAEWGPLWKLLYVRGGLDQYPQNANSAVTNYTAGLGITLAGISFDYAYYMDNLLNSNAAHYFSFGYSPTVSTREVREAKIALGQPVSPEAAAPKLTLIKFKDVPDDSFGGAEINYFATAGVMSGFPDGTFKPKGKLTRAEMAKIICLVGNIDAKRTVFQPAFKDVKKNTWSTPYILEVNELGLIRGYPDKTFKPNKALTRAEAVAIAVKFSELLVPAVISRRPFMDVPLNHWAANSIYMAKESGWLDYIGDMGFRPNSAFTRAEAAYLMGKTAAGMKKIQEIKKQL